MKQQIVVAHFDEDWGWVKQTGIPAVICDKGEHVRPLHIHAEWEDGCMEQDGTKHYWLPNVGRESHSYLYHIVENYDRLADTTLFTQAKLHDHFPKSNFNIVDLFKGGEGISGMRLATGLKEWDQDGRLMHWGKWLDQYNEGALLRSELSMPEWFQKHLNLDINALGSIAYFPGAIFAITKETILRRPKEFYQSLLNDLSHHFNPEKAHYMERSWCYLFREVSINYIEATGNGGGLRKG